MKLFLALTAASAAIGTALAQSTTGIQALVARRLPQHQHDFIFSITASSQNNTVTGKQNDHYTVSECNGKILVQGNSISALSSGLHRYLSDVAHVDIYWYPGSQLQRAPKTLPLPSSPLNGSSIVPWRYHFNTGKSSVTRTECSDISPCTLKEVACDT